MIVVKILESLEYSEDGDGGLDVVEYDGRICMMEYDRGGSLGNILEYKDGKWDEYDGEDLWYMQDYKENELEVDTSSCKQLHTIADSKYDLEDELG